MPREVYPFATAAKAFQICGSLPFAAKVVSEKSDIFKKYLNDIKYIFDFINVIMFDQLLEQLDNALLQAKTLKGPSIQQYSRQNSGPGCDVRKNFGAVTSFSKQQRFKELTKQQLKTEHIQWQNQIDDTKTPSGYSFKKVNRFQKQKPKYVQTYINPNISVVKKNNTNKVPLYKQPVKDLSKSNISVSTVASQTFRGPGLYNVKQEQKVKNAFFPKQDRFRKQKVKYQDNPLFISQNQTKRRPPSCTVMKNKTAKTKQLISREQQDSLRQRLQLVYWKNIPFQLDRMFKNRNGAIIKEDYFNLSKLSGVQKRAVLLMMMDRMNYMRGGYEQDIRKEMQAPCAVIYRKSTPKPFKFSQMDPGPDYYCPMDDFIRASPAAFSFGKAGIIQKKKEYDYRDYQINEEIFKKGGNIIINPQHKQHRLTQEQIKNLQMGPGFYDCLFSQVQKRKDIGVVKFQQITQKNARQNNCIEIKQVNDGLYFPSYNAIDANVPAPLYKKQTDKKPLPNLPDKVLFPQHWLFYDGDLNKVRAEIGKNVILAKNMSFNEYKVYKVKFQNFKEYLQIQRRGPQVGQYSVKYTAIDPHVANINMQRQEQKNMIEAIVKPEGDVDGDNLILNPKKLQDHLPNIEFKKIVGRDDQEIDKYGEPKQGDRLLLNPTKPEKHVPQVDFKKQEGRPQMQQNEISQSPEGDVLILNPKPIENHLPNIDFAKQAVRPEVCTQQNELEQVIQINLQQKKTNVKGVPFSRLSSVRLVPLLRRREQQNGQNDGEI